MGFCSGDVSNLFLSKDFSKEGKSYSNVVDDKTGICDKMLLSQLWIDLFVNLQYNERRKNEREKYN